MSENGILHPERPSSEKMYVDRSADDRSRSKDAAESGDALGLRQLGIDGRLMRTMTCDRNSCTCVAQTGSKAEEVSVESRTDAAKVGTHYSTLREFSKVRLRRIPSQSEGITKWKEGQSPA